MSRREHTPPSVTIERARQLIDPSIGVIRWLAELTRQPDSPRFFFYVAEVCDSSRLGGLRCSAHSASAAIHRDRAKAAAIGEAIERYCSAFYDREQLREAAYQELAPDIAVSPDSFCLFSPSQYNEAGFPFRPFLPATKVSWVEMRSLVTCSVLLVPACFVYVPYEFKHPEACITLSHSTGLACGASREEAFCSALCEVVERDAFMLTWLHRLPVPRIDLEDVEDGMLKEIIARIRTVGLEVHVSDITTDIAIPTFLAVLVDHSGVGPAVAVATRTDPDPVWGIARALEEAVLTWNEVWRRMGSGDAEVSQTPGAGRPRFLNRDKYLLRYARPEAIADIGFLLRSPNTVHLADLANRTSRKGSSDLEACIHAVKTRGFDVLAADVTTREIASAGFCVARIVIPGLQPLDMDEVRRFRGGRRLYTAPRILGYSQRDAAEDELFEVPHPFP